MKPCVFFDRDGVVNTAPPPEINYVTRVQDFHVEPGFLDALRVALERGYAAVIVTNQKCVAHGLITLSEIDAIHDHLRSVLAETGLALTDILVCPHADNECDCRKPKPGMLIEASNRHNLDLARSWMIGDSERDVIAGRAVGCKTIRIKNIDCETVADLCVTRVDALAGVLASELKPKARA